MNSSRTIGMALLTRGQSVSDLLGCLAQHHSELDAGELVQLTNLLAALIAYKTETAPREVLMLIGDEMPLDSEWEEEIRPRFECMFAGGRG